MNQESCDGFSNGAVNYPEQNEHQNAPTTYQRFPMNQESCDGFSNGAGNYAEQCEHPVMGSMHRMGDITQDESAFHNHPLDNISNLTNQHARPIVLASNDTLNLSLSQSSDFNACTGSSSHRSAPSSLDTGIVTSGHEENGILAESHRLNRRREQPEVTRENNYTAQETAYPNVHPEGIFSNSRQLRRMGPNGGIHLTRSGNLSSQGFVETGNGFHAISSLSQPRFLCQNRQVQPVEHSHGLCHNRIYSGEMSRINVLPPHQRRSAYASRSKYRRPPKR